MVTTALGCNVYTEYICEDPCIDFSFISLMFYDILKNKIRSGGSGGRGLRIMFSHPKPSVNSSHS